MDIICPKKSVMDIGQHIMKDTEPCLVGFDSSLNTDKVKSQNWLAV